jgi:heat shock protein HslJ
VRNLAEKPEYGRTHRRIRPVLFILVILGASMVIADARAEADGPDHYRITGIDAGSALNMRTGPGLDAPVIGRIPAGSDGIANFGCVGGMSLAEWSEATEQEREAARLERWCLVGHDRLIGWSNGAFLAEGGPPDALNAGGRLAGLAGSEWRATRIGTETVDVETSIGFKSDGNVAGHAGCNRFTGGFDEQSGRITIGPLAVTRMMCPEPLMRVETALLEVLERAARFVATHLVLVVVDDQERILAQFARTDWD